MELLRAARGFLRRELKHAARRVRIEQQHGLVFPVHVPEDGDQHRALEKVTKVACMEGVSVVHASQTRRIVSWHAQQRARALGRGTFGAPFVQLQLATNVVLSKRNKYYFLVAIAAGLERLIFL